MNIKLCYEGASLKEVRELNKMQAEIERLKEASQYFTCRGHIEVYKMLDEAIAEAEAVAFAKQFWMQHEVVNRDGVTR